MTEILLMRHGKSDWSQPVDDVDRPLLDRGKHDAQRMGAWLKRSDLLPDRVITSPARRAYETAAKCVKAAGLTVSVIQVDSRLYEAGAQLMHEVLDECAGGAGRLLVVGHNPGLDMLLEDLVKAPLPLTPDGKLMTTACLAHLQLSDNRASASLRRLIRPPELPLRYAYLGPDGPALRDRPDYYYEQSAVIPVRQVKGGFEVLMIAKPGGKKPGGKEPGGKESGGKESGGKKPGGKKWSLPKGIVEPGMSPAASAAKEALEEAGAKGSPLPEPVGSFELHKWGGTCRVEVFVMPVDDLLPDAAWESHKRVRRWFPLAKAIEKCRYPVLGALIANWADKV